MPCTPIVGTVVSLARYPVKSMGAETLAAADLHWPWIHGDRQFAFVKASDTSDFPWLTARDLPDLVRFRARYATPGDLARSRVVVTDPDGAEFDLRDPALAARLSDRAGMPVWLLRLGRGCFDAMPVSVLTTASAGTVARAHGGPVAIERFRANIVISPTDPTADEAGWLGQRLVFGPEGAALHVGCLTPRCAMVGIDPMTAARDAGVVRTVAQRFGNRVGAYCSVQAPGLVRAGDTVTLVASRQSA